MASIMDAQVFSSFGIFSRLLECTIKKENKKRKIKENKKGYNKIFQGGSLYLTYTTRE